MSFKQFGIRFFVGLLTLSSGLLVELSAVPALAGVEFPYNLPGRQIQNTYDSLERQAHENNYRYQEYVRSLSDEKRKALESMPQEAREALEDKRHIDYLNSLTPEQRRELAEYKAQVQAYFAETDRVRNELTEKAMAEQKAEESQASAWIDPLLGTYTMSGGSECENFQIMKEPNSAKYYVRYAEKNLDLPQTIYEYNFPSSKRSLNISDSSFSLEGVSSGLFTSVVFSKSVELTKDSSGKLASMRLYSRRHLSLSIRNVYCYR